MVIKNLENKIKLVGIVCGLFLASCIIISVASIVTAPGEACTGRSRGIRQRAGRPRFAGRDSELFLEALGEAGQ